MTSPGPAAPLTLLTFSPMIDSELSRLVLAHYALPYKEERHVFGWASVLALWHVRTVQIPGLYDGRGLRLAGPRAIVDHFDGICPVAGKLVPARQPLATRVEADWDRFNGRLASETAAFAYFQLLPHPDIMMEPFCRGIPALEAAVLQHGGYGLLRKLLTLLLGLSAARARDALVRIRSAFDHADVVLADGRPYMTGEKVTLSDFALAAAVAPLLVPDGYGAPFPPIERLPPDMASVVRELRARPTARFVQRLYAERRRTGVAAAA